MDKVQRQRSYNPQVWQAVFAWMLTTAFLWASGRYQIWFLTIYSPEVIINNLLLWPFAYALAPHFLIMPFVAGMVSGFVSERHKFMPVAVAVFSWVIAAFVVLYPSHRSATIPFLVCAFGLMLFSAWLGSGSATRLPAQQWLHSFVKACVTTVFILEAGSIAMSSLSHVIFPEGMTRVVPYSRSLLEEGLLRWCTHAVAGTIDGIFWRWIGISGGLTIIVASQTGIFGVPVLKYANEWLQMFGALIAVSSFGGIGVVCRKLIANRMRA